MTLASVWLSLKLLMPRDSLATLKLTIVKSSSSFEGPNGVCRSPGDFDEGLTRGEMGILLGVDFSLDGLGWDT